MTAAELRTVLAAEAARLPHRQTEHYDAYGYPLASHWTCPVCGQSLSWLSTPTAMVRAVDRHEQSAKHRKAGPW